MNIAQNPLERRAFVARLAAETLLDARTVARVFDGAASVRPSTVATVRAAARRLRIALPRVTP